jgi:3-oxoacyl-[acyl-carrier-protein] synthase II
MTAAGPPVAVSAWSLHVPGTSLAEVLPELVPAGGAHASGPACPPAAAHQVLGRKGLLGKEPATLLALCAVHAALGLPDRAPRPSGPPDPGTAVVASSNLGNVAAVADLARTVREHGGRQVSPLAAPNASSNVMASAVAMWFRCGGPTVMVCSGATSGLDAVAVGALLIRSGRARRVVVVGAEPADPVARDLHALRGPPAGPLRAGAACVVLCDAGTGDAGTRAAGTGDAAPRLGPVARYGPGTPPAGPPVLDSPQGTVDLAARCAGLYGAQGVAQVVVAAALVASAPSGPPVRVVCGDPADGWRGVDVWPPAAPFLDA